MADEIVADVIANGLMQHPDQPQESHSVSSGTAEFYRAQGVQVTLELPLLATIDGSRSLVAAGHVSNFDNDFLIRELARRLGLHPGFGPSPSVVMLLQDLILHVRTLFPMKNLVPAQNWRFVPDPFLADTWFLRVDNPGWSNNVEASTSSGYRRPRLELIMHEDSVSEATAERAITPAMDQSSTLTDIRGSRNR